MSKITHKKDLTENAELKIGDYYKLQNQFSNALLAVDDIVLKNYLPKLDSLNIVPMEVDNKNKDLIGKLWEKSSNGKCLFLMAVKKNEIGTVDKQIKNKIKI